MAPTLHLFSSVGEAGGNETTVPYNGTFQGQLDKRVESKLGGGGRNGRGRERARESLRVPAMSVEICVLLLNHFPLKKIKKAEIFSNRSFSLPLN